VAAKRPTTQVPPAGAAAEARRKETPPRRRPVKRIAAAAAAVVLLGATSLWFATRVIPVWGDDEKIARWIWRNLVPGWGPCDSVQGELLRSIEKLRVEAQNDGNANWDDGFAGYVDYLDRTLGSEPGLAPDDKAAVQTDLDRLRDYEDPCVDDGPYERLTAQAVAFCRRHPFVTSRTIDPDEVH
jgi:hypothetical protein